MFVLEQIEEVSPIILSGQTPWNGGCGPSYGL